MDRRYEVTDDEWERLRPLLPAMTPTRGGRWRDRRRVLLRLEVFPASTRRATQRFAC